MFSGWKSFSNEKSFTKSSLCRWVWNGNCSQVEYFARKLGPSSEKHGTSYRPASHGWGNLQTRKTWFSKDSVAATQTTASIKFWTTFVTIINHLVSFSPGFLFPTTLPPWRTRSFIFSGKYTFNKIIVLFLLSAFALSYVLFDYETKTISYKKKL